MSVANVKCDNAPSQYGVYDHHHAVQESGKVSHGGLRVVEDRSLAHHGKQIADRENKEAPAHVRKMAAQQTPIASSAYALTLSYARRRSAPTDTYAGTGGKKMSLRRWNNTRYYIVMYYPFGAFDGKLGNNGSNKIPLSKMQHLFMPIGDEDGLRLYYRTLKCACRPCRSEDFGNCEAQDVIPPGAEIKMKAGASTAVTRAEGSDTLAKMNDYLQSLKNGDNVVVRMGGLDPHHACESFFLAKVSAKPWTIEEAGVYAGVPQQKGYQAVEFYWYEYEKTDGNGDFLYRLDRGDGVDPEEYPATTLVPKAAQYLVDFKYDRKAKFYRLHRVKIENIVRYCDLDARA